MGFWLLVPGVGMGAGGAPHVHVTAMHHTDLMSVETNRTDLLSVETNRTDLLSVESNRTDLHGNL